MVRGWLAAIAHNADLKDRFRLIGLVDLDQNVAQGLAAQSRLTDLLDRLDVVLSKTKPDLLFDVVTTASPYSVVVTGLNHGCHVLSEKPMATTLESGCILIELSQKLRRSHATVKIAGLFQVFAEFANS
jgi:predicted dehydrogenase